MRILARPTWRLSWVVGGFLGESACAEGWVIDTVKTSMVVVLQCGDFEVVRGAWLNSNPEKKIKSVTKVHKKKRSNPWGS